MIFATNWTMRLLRQILQSIRLTSVSQLNQLNHQHNSNVRSSDKGPPILFGEITDVRFNTTKMEGGFATSAARFTPVAILWLIIEVSIEATQSVQFVKLFSLESTRWSATWPMYTAFSPSLPVKRYFFFFFFNRCGHRTFFDGAVVAWKRHRCSTDVIYNCWFGCTKQKIVIHRCIRVYIPNDADALRGRLFVLLFFAFFFFFSMNTIFWT